MQLAYLSLGSNLDDRMAHLNQALRGLERLGVITAKSNVYETEPMEVREQPWFLNCVVALETELTALQLLQEVLRLEREMGRERKQPKGPRTIDIDILLFGKAAIDTPELTVPHPALQERRFVLQPLSEIAPDVEHPVLKKTVRELLRELPAKDGAVRLYSAS